MGHYDECREGYCGSCGQTLDRNGRCLSRCTEPGGVKYIPPHLKKRDMKQLSEIMKNVSGMKLQPVKEKKHKMNYELIYKLRKHNLQSLRNLEVQYINEAKEKARVEYERSCKAIAREIGHNDFEITNINCVADGIIGHVFAPIFKGAPKGIGKHKCIFCGNDDFED